MERTVSGRPMTATMAFRVDLDMYRKIVDRARAEGVPVSRILRAATLRGLGLDNDGQKGDRTR